MQSPISQDRFSRFGRFHAGVVVLAMVLGVLALGLPVMTEPAAASPNDSLIDDRDHSEFFDGRWRASGARPPAGQARAIDSPVLERLAHDGLTNAHDLSFAANSRFPDGQAGIVVVARGNLFSDALAGSGLHAGYPMAFTGSDGTLSAAHLDLLARKASEGATAYILGGIDAVPDVVGASLANRGFTVSRLAGGSRIQTAVEVGRVVAHRYGETSGSGALRPSIGTVIVARSDDWADAVTASSLSARYGVPVLLTARESLSLDVAEFIDELYLDSPVLIVGGTNAVSDDVASQLETLTGQSPFRVAGPTRFQTAAAMSETVELVRQINNDGDEGLPEEVAVINLRRNDAWAHALIASSFSAPIPFLFAPVEGEVGNAVDRSVLATVCGRYISVYAVGGTDVVTDEITKSIFDTVNSPCRASVLTRLMPGQR